jgi:predicted aminopeptidase
VRLFPSLSPAAAAAAIFIVVILASACLSSCYLTTQGFRYLGLRLRAVPVDRILADPATDASVRALIDRASAARAFAISAIGLKNTRNFTSIVMVDSDHLATVVQACAELAFDRHLWSYPVVGKLPYRGYFDPDEAAKEAARLRKLGLDVLVRPVDAFSTLGAIADPLFSFMADYGEVDIASLVIHEMTHATIFVKGSSNSGANTEQFNEELATFVGQRASLLWMESVHGKDSAELREGRQARADATRFSLWLRATATELEGLYVSAIPDAEKRRRKAVIIAARAIAFKAEYDGLFVTDRFRAFPMERLDNAYLDLYRLYEGEIELYERYLDAVCGGDLRRFVNEVSRIAKAGKASWTAGGPKDIMRLELSSAVGGTTR